MPTLVSVGSLGFPGFGIAPGVPASIEEDDILVMLAGSHQDVAQPSVSGYTQKSWYQSGTISAGFWWKRTTGSESGPTISGLTNQGSEAIIIAIRGCVDTGDPFAGVGTWEEDSAAAEHETAGLTVSTDDLILHFLCLTGTGINSRSWTGACTTETFHHGNGNGTAQSISCARGTASGSGSSGSATFENTTPGSNAAIAVMFALAEPASGATGTVASTASLTAAASGTPVGTGTAAPTLALSAEAAGLPTVTGTAASSMSLSAVASGRPAVTGTGALALALTAAASGSVGGITGAVAATLALTAAALGTPVGTGAVASTISFVARAAEVVAESTRRLLRQTMLYSRIRGLRHRKR